MNDFKQHFCDNAFIPHMYLESLSRICDLLGMNELYVYNVNGGNNNGNDNSKENKVKITREQDLLITLSDIDKCKKFFTLLCSDDCNISRIGTQEKDFFNSIEIFNKALDICLKYHGASSLSFHNFFNIFIKDSTMHYVYQAVRCDIKPNLSNRIRISSDGTKVHIDSNSYLRAAYFGRTDVMDLLERHYPSVIDSIDEVSRGTPLVFLLKYLHRSPTISSQTPFFAYGRRYNSIDFSKKYKRVMSQEKHFHHWINHPSNISNSSNSSFYKISQSLTWLSLCGFNKYSLPQNLRTNHFGHEIEMSSLIKNNRKELVRKLVHYELDPIFFPTDLFKLTEDQLILNLVKNHIMPEFESEQIKHKDDSSISNLDKKIVIIKSNDIYNDYN